MASRFKYKLPFKKKKKKEVVKDVAPEPVRISLYDITKTNYKITGRVIYLHRCIYLGEHSFEKAEIIEEVLTDIVEHVNHEHNFVGDQHLSGVLLYYERYFWVLVEGSEDTIYYHVNLLFERHGSYIKRSKLIAMVHHIAPRFLNEWICHYGKPSVLVEDLDPNCNLETAMVYLKNCMKKLYDFANAFSEDFRNYEKSSDDDEQDESCDDSGVDSGTRQAKLSIDQVVITTKKAEKEKDPYRDILPEIKVFDFIISCQYLTDLIEIKSTYGVVRPVESYTDYVWPIPQDFIPYDVFNKPRDPVNDFPKPTRKAEEGLLVADADTTSSHYSIGIGT